ncbi:hypothetical protein B7494_g8309 [Chlorociboria aeruginascens]|nr:hypothetical protein B7494_g8309 [Chlorociboria aeruginascens]
MRNYVSKSVALIAVLGLALPIYAVAVLHAMPPAFPIGCKEADGDDGERIAVVYSSTEIAEDRSILTKCAIVGGICEDKQDCFDKMADFLDICPEKYEDRYVSLAVAKEIFAPKVNVEVIPCIEA